MKVYIVTQDWTFFEGEDELDACRIIGVFRKLKDAQHQLRLLKDNMTKDLLSEKGGYTKEDLKELISLSKNALSIDSELMGDNGSLYFCISVWDCGKFNLSYMKSEAVQIPPPTKGEGIEEI